MFSDSTGFSSPMHSDVDEMELSLIKSGPSTRSDQTRHQGETGHPSEYELLTSISHKATVEGAERVRRQLFDLYGHDKDPSASNSHAGVVFKHLVVKSRKLGTECQPDLLYPLYSIRMWLRKMCVGTRLAEPHRTLLNDFSGVIKPGQMLLVLGRPSAGCSTFLKTIGNQQQGFLDISGKLAYGGLDQKVMRRHYGTEVLYSGEEDLHYPTLTVRETLEFALNTRVPMNSSWFRKSGRKRYVKDFFELLVKVFWLEHILDTVVGNRLVPGISGGEKKRVSIAEAFISKASNICFDCSTRGLDAITAREYVRSLRALSNLTNVSIAAALYQASEQLFQQFDKVLVIDQGHCLYFGPIEKAVAYFEKLGLFKPAKWTSADFLVSIMDKEKRITKPEYENRVPGDATQMGHIFRKSEVNKANWVEIATFEAEIEPCKKPKSGELSSSGNYGLSLTKQIFICTQRQLLIVLGDKKSLAIKWGGLLFNAFIIGTMFLNLPQTTSGVFPRGGMLWILLLNNSLVALAEMTAIFDGRGILQKHKSFAFYRPTAAAVAQSIADIPLILIQVVVFDLIAYLLANLQRTAACFFTSVLLLWAVTMTLYAFFRALAALSISLDDALKFAGVAVQAFITYTGYLIPPSDMRAGLAWLRFVNPIQYAFEALLSNEFYGLQIRCEPPYLVPAQKGILAQYQGCALRGSVPGEIMVDGERYIESAYEYRHSELWLDFGCICAFCLLFLVVSAFGLELQRPNSRIGSVASFKRGKCRALDLPGLEKSHRKQSLAGNLSEGAAEFVDGESSSSSWGLGSKALGDGSLTWLNIDYRIKVKNSVRKLLTNQQGLLRPGKLTALMGASGASKTTLLNALAQRTRGARPSGETSQIYHSQELRLTIAMCLKLLGQVFLRGQPLTASFRRHTGFAEQEDVHEPTATVREALRFAALLRQRQDVPMAARFVDVEEIIDLLDLRHLADAVIGHAPAGLNLEQRKRLTIGLEVASRADLYFCDEPTSGLDAASAFKIVRLLKKLSENGCIVLCTIHQPSPILFEQFDELILLKSGQTVYHHDIGSDASTLRSYFESNGAARCAPDANPAEWMPEITGAGDPNYKGIDWIEAWSKSPMRQQQTLNIQEIHQSKRDEQMPQEQTLEDQEFAMPLLAQVNTVTKRRFVVYWRTPRYVYGKILLHVYPALLNTFTFYRLRESEIDMQSRLFSVFQTISIAPPVIQQLQPRYLEARHLYQSREGKCQMYSWIAFTIASIVVEIPYSVVSGTIYFFCWYYGPGFPRDLYIAGTIYLYMLLLEFFFVTFGLALAALSSSELVASLLVPLFFQLITRFAGAFVPPADLPSFWRAWMYPLTPFRYFLKGMLGLVVHEVPVQCAREELAVFCRPEGLASGLLGCQALAGDWVQSVGMGYLVDLAEEDEGLCGYCRFENGDQFAATFNIYYKNHWRDFGIGYSLVLTVAACSGQAGIYVGVNFSLIFLFTWLYLEGWTKVKAACKSWSKKHEEEEEELVEAAQPSA